MPSNLGTVLVTCAAGAQGQAVVSKLQHAGAKVRVLLRPETANPFGAAVDVVRGDLADLERLRFACLGVDALALTLPNIPDREQLVRYGRNAIEAAGTSGVKLIVFNTGGRTTSGTGVGPIEAKAELAAYLHATGIPSIVLRPTLYMNNMLMPWSLPAIVHQGILAYPLRADLGVSWLSRDDLADYMVAALRRPELAGNWLDLGGPDVLTGPEVAAILSETIGRTVDYVPVPLTVFAAQLNATLGPGVGDEVAAVYDWFERQPVSPLAVNWTGASAALGVKPTSFRDWARSHDWTALAQARAAA